MPLHQEEVLAAAKETNSKQKHFLEDTAGHGFAEKAGEAGVQLRSQTHV